MVNKRSTNRIVLNTTVSYTRTLISIVLILFSSRWALSELGVSDFGIYNVVGSILSVVVFLNTVISNGDARFYSIAIGKDDKEELVKVFNTSFSLHLVMPFVVVFLSLFLGEWIIANYLVIPNDRMEVTIWVFRITMLVSCFDMVTVPFVALFVAHQNIAENTLISFLRTILTFLSAYVLRFIEGDKLLAYAILLAFSQLFPRCLEFIVARRMYNCARIKLKYFFNKEYTVNMLKFSFWNLLGDLGHLIRTQGIAVVTNLHFGPSGNAALGVANQISIQACNLTNAMVSATAPEIYTRVGEGKYESALKMASFVSKIALLLMAFLGIPILFNMRGLLNLWLINPPKGAYELSICFIIMFILEKLASGFYSYLAAINKVALVQTLVFFSFSLSIVFPFCGLLDYGIVGIGIACIISMFLSRMLVFYCLTKYTSITFLNLLKRNLLPLVFLSTIFIIIYFLLADLIATLNEGIFSLICSVIITLIMSSLCGYKILFTANEKNIILSYIKKIRK